MRMHFRPFQKVMTTTTGVMCREPEVISGKGSLYQVIVELIRQDKKSILVATTPGTIKRGTLQGFFDELNHSGIKATVFTEIEPDPTIESIEKMVEAFVAGECEAFVAIGGGSVIDCAKGAAARIVRPKKSIRELKGIMKVRHEIPTFFAVPTTAGTGSEATAAAVVTDTIDGVHYKYSISDPVLIPHYAVLDPSLSLTLPKDMTAWTGMDALTHAVEAYTNKYASKKVGTMAREATRLIIENLMVAYEAGYNYEARENMLMGSYYAGIAFTNNFVGYVHAIAHAVGAIYGIPHGKANAIILPYVLEQFGSAVYTPLSELAVVAGIVSLEDDFDSDESFDEFAAKRFIKTIRNMNEAMGIPSGIDELRVEDFDEIIGRAMFEANPTYPVPVIWGEAEFGKVLGKLLLKLYD